MVPTANCKPSLPDADILHILKKPNAAIPTIRPRSVSHTLDSDLTALSKSPYTLIPFCSPNAFPLPESLCRPVTPKFS